MQELALVAWTLLAVWTVVPGGRGADAAWIAILAAGAVAIAALAVVRARLARRVVVAPEDRERREPALPARTLV